jgi:hypothetical protein
MNMNWIQRVVACGMACLVTATAGGQTIDGSWTVIAGSDALSKTAAADLREILSREKGVTLAGTGEGQPAIVIGTVEDNPAIAEAHAQKAFAVPEGSPEAYHMVMRDERLFVVGATPKGAMNGVFRLVDRPTLDVTGLDEAKKPVFRHRAGGHRINQSPPADWTDLDQARFQARHFINIVWGEKHGPSLPLEVRQAYGLGLMVEMKFPPFIGNTRDYMDEAKYASAVYYHKGSEGRRVLDPFDPVGREAYLQSYAELLAVNPDTKILYALFGDYSVIPSPESRRVSDGQAYAHTRVETMQEILGIMREALRRAGIEDAEAVAWLWHGFFGEPPGTEEKFMAWCRDNGYGILYNEAGNNDNWLIRRDNFNEAALRTGEDGKSMWGEDYYPLVSVGGACESVNPLIAMPLPYVAAHKLSRLVDAKVNNLVLGQCGGVGLQPEPGGAGQGGVGTGGTEGSRCADAADRRAGFRERPGRGNGRLLEGI